MAKKHRYPADKIAKLNKIEQNARMLLQKTLNDDNNNENSEDSH
jgi:hypothetical protein